ncbi:MAG: FKBP-type peptidyl-prolyl cis-trans isomerase [Mariprofundaceae bacterium]
MKKNILTAVVVAMLAACAPQEKAADTLVALDSDTSKFSYAVGLEIGKSLKAMNTEIDRAALIEAVNVQLDAAEPRMKVEDARKVQQEFFKKRALKQAEERKSQGAGNKVTGEKFLAENAKKDGVTVTASGLQYEVLKMGEGMKPKSTDKVKVHYRGTLLDGKEFDSSYKRGKPISFPLNGVIKGWTEGVQLMPVGSKFKFVIPAGLAYGENGAGKVIAPNSTLIFEVELLAIETAAEEKK